jgi:hypothetical protein
MKEDFIYEHPEATESEDEDEQNYNENFNIENIPTDENGNELIKRNLNIIINKSVLFKNYVKEEEEKRSAEKTNKQEFSFGGTSQVNTKGNMDRHCYNNGNINMMNNLDQLPSLRLGKYFFDFFTIIFK